MKLFLSCPDDSGSTVRDTASGHSEGDQEAVRAVMEARGKAEQECHNSVSEDRPWKAQIHGSAGERSFEISVINAKEVEYVQLGYGWFDQRKLLVTHNGGPCDWPIIERVWTKMVKAANEVANELNDAHATR